MCYPNSLLDKIVEIGSEHKMTNESEVHTELDARGLSCPLPLLKMKQALSHLKAGESVLVLATDSGSVRDFHSFIALSEHSMVEFSEEDNHYSYIIEKG